MRLAKTSYLPWHAVSAQLHARLGYLVPFSIKRTTVSPDAPCRTEPCAHHTNWIFASPHQPAAKTLLTWPGNCNHPLLHAHVLKLLPPVRLVLGAMADAIGALKPPAAACKDWLQVAVVSCVCICARESHGTGALCDPWNWEQGTMLRHHRCLQSLELGSQMAIVSLARL